jgi:hypothetical protein
MTDEGHDVSHDVTGEAAAEVIYLDVDDEITSAAARLRRAEAARVAFVLPYGSRLATSRINFRLLAREASNRGKRLEIVAADASARALAGSAGLRIHPSVAALEAGPDAESGSPPSGVNGASPGSPSRADPRGLSAPTGSDGSETRLLAVPRAAEPVPIVGRRPPPVRTRTALLVGALILALVGAGGIGAFLYLPSATIVLTPTAETIGPLHLTVQARTDVTVPDATSLTVPARQFRFDLTATQSFPATGTKVTEAKATGSVTFANFDTGSGASIPAGSIVRTEQGTQFATLTDVSLSHASFDFFPPFTVHPATADVGIVAVQAGPEGNVGANAITVIPKGQSKQNLRVTNPDPTAGGSHEESPQVSQHDVDAALATLNQVLSSQLDAKVASPGAVPAGTTLFETTKTVGSASPSVDPATLVGTLVTDFDLGLSATGTVIGVDPSPVTALAEQRLMTTVGDGWQLQGGSTHIDVGDPTVEAGTVSFPVTATAIRDRIVDRDGLIAEIRGLVLAQARSRLEAVGQVSINLWPAWVSTIPTDTGRISLTIEAAAPAPSPTLPGVAPSGAASTSGSPTDLAGATPTAGATTSTAP